MDNDKIIRREDRILHREPYYKKARIYGFIVGAILLLVYIAPYFIKNLGNPPVVLLILIFISFMIGYESHIRIKHIETIKFYRAKQTVRSL